MPWPRGDPPIDEESCGSIAHGVDAHKVTAALGFDSGDLRIEFADGCVLETFINQASATVDAEGDSEFLRLLPPATLMDGDAPHFVVTADGTRV